MRRYRVTLEILVDEEARQALDADENPVGQPVEEWYDSDLVLALDAGIAEVAHEELDDVEDLGDED